MNVLQRSLASFLFQQVVQVAGRGGSSLAMYCTIGKQPVSLAGPRMPTRERVDVRLQHPTTQPIFTFFDSYRIKISGISLPLLTGWGSGHARSREFAARLALVTDSQFGQILVAGVVLQHFR